MLTARNKKLFAPSDRARIALILTFFQREKECSKERRFETAVLFGRRLKIAAPCKDLPLHEGEGWGEGHRRCDLGI